MPSPSPHSLRIGIAFCTPMPFVNKIDGGHRYDTITPQWHRKRSALATPTNFNVIEVFCDGMEVGEARNLAVKKCLEHDPVPEFLFFLDNDVLPEFDAVTKLIYRARELPQYDVYAGVYVCKWSSPPEPLIYSGNGTGAFWDWTIGDLLTTDGHEITGTHMGLTLVRLSLFEDLPWDDDLPWFHSVNEQEMTKSGLLKNHRGTEDLWFYKTAMERGREISICVDTSVLAGHIDKNSGVIYGLDWNSAPVQRQKALYSPDKQSEGDEKIALDIGCGETHREWEGYRTYRMDIRPECKPDYCQDTRRMNLPDDNYDLVSSSHHLEHLGRWDQEQVWSEIFRITKPGGHIEHIVPSLEWAAHKIFDGKMDEHVMNVIYGAQEAHGYERIYNTHFFGYTKPLAAEMARSAGFENVQLEDWRDDPEHGYNLIIRATKPLEKPIEDEGSEPSEVEASSDAPEEDCVDPDEFEPPILEDGDDLGDGINRNVMTC